MLVDNARIYGGMHYRHSVKQGNRLGRLVTEYVLSRHFKARDEWSASAAGRCIRGGLSSPTRRHLASWPS